MHAERLRGASRPDYDEHGRIELHTPVSGRRGWMAPEDRCRCGTAMIGLARGGSVNGSRL